jgi:hypothetical protein
MINYIQIQIWAECKKKVGTKSLHQPPHGSPQNQNAALPVGKQGDMVDYGWSCPKVRCQLMHWSLYDTMGAVSSMVHFGFMVAFHCRLAFPHSTHARACARTHWGPCRWWQISLQQTNAPRDYKEDPLRVRLSLQGCKQLWPFKRSGLASRSSKEE